MPHIMPPSAFWAKVGPRARPDRTEPQPYHPLICHMIDVSMVALALWRNALSPWERRRLTAELGLGEDEDAAGRWLALWAGAHDIGKASPSFQAKHGAARERLTEAGLAFPRPLVNAPHGIVSAAVLPELLAPFRVPPRLARSVAIVVGGHHGTLPSAGAVMDLPSDALGAAAWERGRAAVFQAFVAALDPTNLPMPTRLSNAAGMALAGLVSVADWIGSDEQYFRYQSQDGAIPELDVAGYAETAAGQADRALADLHWTTWRPASLPLSFQQLFEREEPRPFQAGMVEIAERLDRPGLVLIEAPMGEGKTEAALYLADRWGLLPGLRGCYVALPTQATSNQMFGRVERFLAHRYPGGMANLLLLHGHAALSAELRLLRARAERLLHPGGIYDDEPGADELPDVLAADWFTYRKRGLLAPFGVGTIDQALLAALQMRHGFVRLLGLAGKTVILDEVHAYDAYMTALLERLLEWLAALGSGVVLLSATLPASRRRALVNAYLRGAGASPIGALPDAAYPRITWIDGVEVRARAVAASSLARRTVHLERVDGRLPDEEGGEFPLLKRLRDVLANGGRVAVICNTVGRAQRIYLGLRSAFAGTASDGGPRLDLFHARYLFEERQVREERALERFGSPTAGKSRPDLAILVATQVIEQSLDLDFDLLVTDLAPVDLILQRCGRLHRHQREDRPLTLQAPTVWVLWPETDADGVPTFDRGSASVYDEHVLLRSWLALLRLNTLRLPDDIELLIESVYDDRGCPEHLTGPLRQRWHETRARLIATQEAEQDTAKSKLIAAPHWQVQLWEISPDRLQEDNPEIHQAFQALTRLADPTASVVCLFDTPHGPALDRDGRRPVKTTAEPNLELAEALLLRSIQVGDRRVVGVLLEQEPPSGWQRSALLRQHRLLLQGPDGQLRLPDGRADFGSCRLRLHPKLGLQVLAVRDGGGEGAG